MRWSKVMIAFESSLPAAEAAAADARAMARAREGDWEAFGQLVERHRRGLVRYLARLVSSRERGEELAQETFVRLWLAAGRYREEGRFEAYLYRIGTRLARSSERRERLRLRNILSGAREVKAEAFEDADASSRLLREEEARELARAVAALPLRFRAPLILHAIEERPIAEISQLLGVPPGTVKTRLFRARRRLRETLGDFWNGEAS
ncbi:MAG: RNA polymerase sigma factor [Thermoanaerobaculia bacterium]